MKEAREEILSRVGASLKNPPREYSDTATLPSGPADRPESLLEEFSSRLEDLGGHCHLVAAPADWERVLPAILETAAGRTVALAESALEAATDLKTRLVDLGATVIPAEPGQSRAADIGFSGARLALAYSGTVLVSSEFHGELAASLLPSIHVAVMPLDRLVYGVPKAIETFQQQGWPRCVSFITGPSRTADIELTLVKGVHGPGLTHVVFVKN